MAALAKLWDLRDERPLFVALCLVTIVLLVLYPFVDWWLRSIEVAGAYRYHDFGAFRAAVERWHAGEALYQRAEDGGFHGSYLYPPVVLPLFLPFEGLDHRAAGQTWALLSVVGLWLALQLVVRSVGGRLQSWERVGLLWLLAGFHPLLFALKLGQLAPFMAALLCVALVALANTGEHSRAFQYLSGAVTAVVGVIKFAYAPVGAHLLADWRRFVGAIGAGVALAVISLLWFGVDVHRTYLEVLLWGVGQGSGSRPPTLWLPGYYKPLHWLPAAQWIRIAVSLLVAGYALLAPRSAHPLAFAVGVAAFPLLTPLAYTYYFVPLLPAIVVLLAGELERDGYPAVPVAGLLLLHLHAFGLKFAVDWLPQLFPPFELLAPYWVLQPGLWGNLLVFGLAFVRLREAATRPLWLERRWGQVAKD
ncbi:glycosyltransferase family 87 protein [Halosimplex aquaticum]|uniref:Glycosyltransferase family 87 protein n=1 Tax=Halosimplex aquaticum TaxID=3026162 RepID=A0ABD5Y789_9EURY|nr:glycosyltransferase family 87 protein [Halosimplex aquaticum]